MRLLFLALALVLTHQSFAAPVTCVAYCQQRSPIGRCTQRGPDYCDVGPGVACIPQCFSRTIQGRCNNYMSDFCGIYPTCVPKCGQYSVNGMCLRWDRDDCFWG